MSPSWDKTKLFFWGVTGRWSHSNGPFCHRHPVGVCFVVRIIKSHLLVILILINWSGKASFTLTRVDSASLVNFFLELGSGSPFKQSNKGFKSVVVSLKCGRIQLIAPNNFWKSFKVSKRSFCSCKGHESQYGYFTPSLNKKKEDLLVSYLELSLNPSFLRP